MPSGSRQFNSRFQGKTKICWITILTVRSECRCILYTFLHSENRRYIIKSALYSSSKIKTVSRQECQPVTNDNATTKWVLRNLGDFLPKNDLFTSLRKLDDFHRWKSADHCPPGIVYNHWPQGPFHVRTALKDVKELRTLPPKPPPSLSLLSSQSQHNPKVPT